MVAAIRHSIRLLRRSPALTVASVCTLAVAIGASTAVFSVIDKVLVRPLPIDEPERVVVMWSRERLNAGSIGEFSYAAFRSWQRDTRAFETLAAIGSSELEPHSPRGRSGNSARRRGLGVILLFDGHAGGGRAHAAANGR